MSETHPPQPPAVPQIPSLSTARIETLADGVFAIVMTLLVFDMRVPVQETVASVGLLSALITLFPNFLSYIISFVILGVFWVGHHNQFFYIRRSDRALLWINILFLMVVAMVPFSAALLSRYGSDATSIIVYDLNLISAGLVLYLHWSYAVRDEHLVGHTLDPRVNRLVRVRILTPPAYYVIAIIVSLFSVQAALVLNVLIPIIYILPANFDQVFRGHNGRPHN